MTFVFKFEEVTTSNGQIPGPGIDSKVVNVNNSTAKRHKSLKMDTPGIFMMRNSMVISIFKFEHAMSPYGRPPGSGVDPQVTNVNNSVVKRHRLLKTDKRGIFMTRNLMVISVFKFEHAMTSYGQPGGPTVTKQYISFQQNLQILQSFSILSCS